MGEQGEITDLSNRRSVGPKGYGVSWGTLYSKN